MANIRAKIAMQKMVANGGKHRSLARAMREAGYSEAYARNPQKLKATKAWTFLADELLPDEHIIATHAVLAEATRLRCFRLPVRMSDTAIAGLFAPTGLPFVSLRSRRYTTVICLEIDTSTRLRAVDLAYRVKGSYRRVADVPQESRFAGLSDSDLRETVNSLEALCRRGLAE